MARGERTPRGEEIRDASHEREGRRFPSHVRRSVLPFDANGKPLFSKLGRAPGTKTMIVKTIAFDLDGTLI